MSTFPKATKQRPRKEPRFLQLARAFYGQAFGARRVRDISAAMAEWSELTDDEQSFTLAHLHYLDLLAQAQTQKLLLQVRDLLDEVAEGIGDVIDPVDENEDDDGLEGDAEPPPAPENLTDEEPEPVLEDAQDDAEPQGVEPLGLEE